MPTLPNVEATSGATKPSGYDFPPITRDHILHCSYDYWFPTYRTSCIKSRFVPLTPEFLEYIREDGILLADDDQEDDDDDVEWEVGPSSASAPPRKDDSDSESDSDEEAPAPLPPNQRFPELHQAIKDKIAEVGGAAAPKLNWTAPKDAAFISPHQNTIKCTSPNDVYLLLKSSNFITYDLEHAFDDCTPTPNNANATPFKPVLVLRSFFNPHTALEFRCFVKHRSLVGITQRDLNYYEFLKPLRAAIVSKIDEFFNHKLRYTFPDGNFVFDVYIPEGEDEPLGRVRLIDINAWAPHTDSLLFGWNELLEMIVPGPLLGVSDGADNVGVRPESDETSDEDDDDDDDNAEEEDFVPELRLIEQDDPSACNFSSTPYSAHKLPKDVVDAASAGQGGMMEFAKKWKEMVEYRENIAAWEKEERA
ncbi:cell division cycle protein [Pseudomassariella vexata]|uniref:Cell division cycle protein n=1 Tax=Pseudomassariella vexata TaxID=1141098 RepID=A0A1Y2EDM2_9PEZI|nr:cell division cycle protein [Pseudomassariella vexata]ORY69671.1 cell division cycle protein [Pseudomassariella vexata]